MPSGPSHEMPSEFSIINTTTEGYKAGDTILFLFKRRGSTLFLTLTIEE
jgi:hypothetical protein